MVGVRLSERGRAGVVKRKQRRSPAVLLEGDDEADESRARRTSCDLQVTLLADGPIRLLDGEDRRLAAPCRHEEPTIPDHGDQNENRERAEHALQ